MEACMKDLTQQHIMLRSKEAAEKQSHWHQYEKVTQSFLILWDSSEQRAIIHTTGKMEEYSNLPGATGWLEILQECIDD